ncbi:hypothetical protein LRB11_13165 [Ectothiorhodospira haloalkaliphila]|uniref:type III-B CRISPR module-associated Cmr3 family protein n=1 Tax=Ectothiorhodospira haloalkaliphila TaxID=421628 RepID=UPI001EE7E0EB|nr:type III-B CRISPR module-associated Cmr3 family protein [Ectothiorhodospira haloalkaliphila]MCG5525871.1 hypothetical protein [Ectothiorhodospira haloalkaliphila]
MDKLLSISALDTLFFRESRPFDTIGGSELASVFPPPPRALAGAIKARLAEALGVDWHVFHKNPDSYEVGGHRLKDLIGDGDEWGRLKLRGPWPCLDGERLYPAPLNLLADGECEQLARLCIGPAARTHLGQVRLPTLPGDQRGLKPLEHYWLTAKGFARVLAGGCPAPSEIRHSADLVTHESRLGIGRDNRRRTAEEGLLYQTRHLRPIPGLRLEVDIDGLPEDLPSIDGLARLGGEGRMAHFSLEAKAGALPEAPPVEGNPAGLILTLLTPARLAHGTWLPPDFEPVDIDGMRHYRGTLHGIELSVEAAVIGKPLREGGWDMARRRPRPVNSLLPAGSAWFCRVEDASLATAIKQLHGTQIGADGSLGRGLLACGLWPESDNQP